MRFAKLYLMLTVALTGALVMVVEVLGSRVIGPFFGVSLFVWTALIAVTLLSLALGYIVGGQLADRRPSPDWLFGLIILAGLAVALVPVLKAPVIELTVPLGLRIGALVSASLLFAPALILLGCVSPYVVRIATQEWAQLGRTVGVLYALSTAGSFAGTALTGFYLIAYVGVSRAFYLAGALLCLIGVGHFLLFRRRLAASAVLLPFVFALSGEAPMPGAVLADGTRVQLIDQADSFYGNVKVVEYRGVGITTREMMIDGLIQGGIDINSGQSIYEYAYLMEHLAIAAKPDMRSALLVGLGPGVVVGNIQRRGIAAEVVDIDPLVARMAVTHFGFRPATPVVVADGRYALAAGQAQYDAIFMDVFNGDITPGHLLSREALAQVRRRLSPDGVFVMNLVASLDADSQLLPAVLRTLRTQFSELAVFPVFDTGGGQRSGNLVLLARNGELDAALALREIPGVHALADAGVRLALTQGRRPDAAMLAGIELSDDFNPLDLFDIGLHEAVRKSIIRETPAAILLHG